VKEMSGDLTVKKRVDTGVPGLNSILHGGIPRGAMVMVIGPPGSGKTIFSRQFLYQGLIEGEHSILLSTNQSLEEVKISMLAFDWDSKHLDRLLFADCYSWRLGEKGGVYSASVTLPSDVSIMLNRLIDENKITPDRGGRLVIDTFSDFLILGEGEGAIRFLSALKPRLKVKGITTLLLVEGGVHDEKTVSAIEYITDGTVKMKIEGENRYTTVSRMHLTPVSLKWIPFDIRRGIELKAAAFLK